MAQIRIALHQMTTGINPPENVKLMVAAIREAADAGAKMYFAPEMSLLLDRDKTRAREHVRSQDEDPCIRQLCEAAASSGIWVHTGSSPVLSAEQPDKFANRSIVIDDNGRIVETYDKIHLFDVNLSTGESWRESSTYLVGSGPKIVDCPLGRLGLAVCYDMRFPELFAQLAKAGVTALAVPAAFTVPTGRAHWHILLRARAIESAAFVIAAAQSGKHEDGRETFGHSLVIDPWGEILLDMGEGPGLGYADIDLARVDEVRAQIPVHLNRQDIPPLP